MQTRAYVQKLKPHEFDPWHGKRLLLGQLDIELTERCNNNCLHCCINLPENDEKARSREMDTAFFKDVLAQAAGLGCLTVRFTGGEPLLRGDFEDLYLFARRSGLRVILFTNARLITPALARLLARIPPGRLVEVTVYGMSAASYDAAAASPGAFEEFRRGIALLREHSIPFIVKQAILPPNRHERAAFEAFAATIPWMDKSPSYAMNYDLRGRRDNPAKNRLIEKLRLSPEETTAVLAANPRYVDGMREFCGKFMRPPGEEIFSCGAGHGACIDAYGRAQMCMGLRHPDAVFDLRRPTEDGGGNSPLRYALTEFFPRLRKIRATNPEYLRRCARCFLKGLCEQCPAKSWQEHGTLDTPVEYLCAVAHAQARFLGLLGEGESAWEVEDARARVASFAKRTNMNMEEKEHT
jgi:MoaA/NifB/PqqE/SkfB family radical SAM enzyme